MWSEVYPVVPQPSPLPHGPSARSEFYLACYLVSPVLVGVPVVAQDVECVDARPRILPLPTLNILGVHFPT